MRILHVTPTYSPCVGGAERTLRAVSERLVARGHQVTVFAVNGATQREIMSPDGGSLPEHETINGVTVRRFPPEGRATRAFRQWTKIPGAWRSSALVLREGVGMIGRRPSPLPMLAAVLRAEADVVTAMNWVFPPAYAGHLARRVRTFPLVGIPLLHVARPWAESPSFPPMLAACDGLIANTRAEEEFMVARGGRHVVVAGTGITPEDFARPDGGMIRRRLGLGDWPVVGFVGRQDRLKGALTLIEAMRDVWRSTPEARLLLAGQSAHRSREVNDRLTALSPDERARVALFDDFQDEEIAHITDACTLVAMPSVEEAFGIAYLEGWMCGKPVIGARIPSTACVIDDGGDGLLVEPFNVAELSKSILALLGDASLRDRMGAAGRAKTLENHTWDAVTDRWERMFNRLFSPRS
ncbi:MAG TPA: glycosyltransferase family 4 protein [Gemmatimonadales bacterium]|nr:glycosyltransferase family 4 protein [Gemmatimonadales bacterium]